ncbi:MAG: NAD(P)-binding domain-containing protein, partial [Actinobacteria bacterium]|nr:NAD(P)-binding domain-containing protein [Actinomycetota bacterium]
MATKVAVIGAGSWGTAVAAIACHNAPTVLWARRKELADEITTDHVNSSYLADYPLPEALGSSASLEEALTDADVVIMGVPSHGFRAVLA